MLVASHRFYYERTGMVFCADVVMVSQVKKERLVLINVAVRLFHVLVNLVKVRCIAESCRTVLILNGRGLVPLGIFLS